ncbi:MAG: NUMOD3 domain-containing DNA-binding protein [Atribacterota bacterium]|jgi:hypothetical protein|nr:NUMOD3 domain-containing DNA-binding protein [Atribacterota bacterium]
MATGIYQHKSHTEETKRKISNSHKGKKTGYSFWKGKKHPQTEESKKKISKTLTGRVFSKEHRRKLSLSAMGNTKNIGEKNGNWKGGISKNPYPKKFNLKLKLKIRTRDNFTCCLCGRTEREELEELNRVLCVNHIDFDKNNCKEDNLNTLCLRCNTKINRERDYWSEYFMNKN